MGFCDWLKSQQSTGSAHDPVVVPPLAVMPSAIDFPTLGPFLAEKYHAASIASSKASEVATSARIAREHKDKYDSVSKALAIPWWFIAGLHMRESGYDFKGCLQNGDPWNKVTVHVPRGLGPWSSWEAAAVDALKGHGGIINQMPAFWTTPRALYEAHKFNGFGYITGGGQHTIPSRTSPYLWSMTTEYKSGKYVADGKFSSTAVDQQVGVAALWKQLGLL